MSLPERKVKTILEKIKEKAELNAQIDAEIDELQGDGKVKITRTSLKGSKNPIKGK